MNYTTVEAIKDKLQGRLSFGASSHIGGRVVSEALIARTIEQKEDWLNMILNVIYRMPLKYKHAVLAEIVEDLTCETILRVNFQGMQVAEGSDVSGIATSFRSNANQLLYYLTVGHNIPIQGIQPIASIPGASTPQPLFLPGEEVNPDPPDTLTANVTVIGQRTVNSGDVAIFESFDVYSSRARGADRPRWGG